MIQRITLAVVAFLFAATPVVADERDAFAQQLDLSPMESLSIQHSQTLKTFDSFARQTLSLITGKSRLDGRDAVYVVLDISFQPTEYVNRNIIRIKSVPLRQDFADLRIIDEAEKQRIIQEGTISLHFYKRPEVQELLGHVQSTATFKFDAVNDLKIAAAHLEQLAGSDLRFWPLIVPATSDPSDHIWKSMNEVAGVIPGFRQTARQMGFPPMEAIPEYQPMADTLQKTLQAMVELRIGWMRGEAAKVNENAALLAELLPQVNPEVYPSSIKRITEVIYNRLAKLTLPGAAFYFVAFVCFVMAARSRVAGLRLWGLRFLVIGFLVHTAGIGIRWWLVEKSVGNWFESIPIKNQFESVLFSAWFGALVGLVLELRKGKSVFGAGSSFVGWLSLTAIFATPYVFKREIGGEIGQAAGVLMSYWLYIHVTVVTASYALIGMSFCLGVWWLIRYVMAYGTMSRLPARQLSADAAERDEDIYRVGGGAGPAAGAGALSMWQTLAMLLFVRRPQAPSQAAAAQSAASDASPADQDRTRSFLATLDLCNLVVLQLAFWLLGVGIILGAVWADQSWGRPWGWDPKETFALVTWIVYLIIVHVRFVTPDKAFWTAVLSVIGFFVMLFNWIGVNFFLVGLHSYA